MLEKYTEFISRDPLTLLFERSFDNEYISVLTGQRQIGKTTFIKKFLSDHKQEKFFYLNLDKLSNREELEKFGLEKLIESFFKEKINEFHDTKVVVIDEAQKVPNIFEEIKIIFDEIKHSKKIKFIISGSSSLDLYSKSAESLAGRVNFKRAHSFNLSESCSLMAIDFVKTPFWKVFDIDFKFKDILKFEEKLCPISDQTIQNLINNLVVYGSIPDVVKKYKNHLQINEIIDYLKDYKNTYIEKDVRSLGKIGDISLFSKTFDLICAQSSNILVKSNVSKDLEINFETLQNYLSILENTFVIDILQPYSPSTKKRIIKTPKSYVFDNGLMSLAHGFLSLDQLKKIGLIGAYFENFVYNELKKLLVNRSSVLDFYFYRTKDDVEIDFVLDYKRKVIPIEVKWNDSKKNLNLSTLKKFIQEEANCEYGVVVYNGEFFIDKENHIVFFPAQYFAATVD